MSAALVLDASAAVACAAPDESPPASLLHAVKSSALVVPALWPFEVYHVFWMLRRRSRITDADFSMALQVIDGFTVDIEPASIARVRVDTLALAMRHNLTVYDAAYLELAIRRRIPLATLDGDLVKAAKKAKVKLV